jgi:hypothetical protein
MQRLSRDGYTYYPMKDPMDNGGLSGMCSKNATSMPPLLCRGLLPLLIRVWFTKPRHKATIARLAKVRCVRRVQRDNGKCYFVNENICINAYDTNTIQHVQIESDMTFWLLRLAPLKETLCGCREQSECWMKAGQEWIDHHDMVETWKSSAVVIGLFTPCGLSPSLRNIN